MNIDVTDRKEQRKFGIVMAVAITVLGLIRWAIHGFAILPVNLFGVAAAFLALGLVAPPVLRPVLIVWMKFAEALNWAMTRILLTLAFFILIIPVRVIMKIVGFDPLNRAWDPTAATYWEDADDQPKEFERYLDQF